MIGDEDLKIGMIGLDTSHSVEFTARLHDRNHPHHVPGGRVVVACPTMSPDMPWSSQRAAGFVNEMASVHGVAMVGSIEEMLPRCDAVLLCSLDGRPHLEQFRACAVGKPVFVDKPVAASYADVIALYELARQTRTPVFSASVLRWFPGVMEVEQSDVGELRSAISYGPAPIDPRHPDLFFYGIHPTEALFTIMGEGCESVSRITTEHTSVVVGKWSGGRIGTLHAMHRWPAEYRIIKFGDEGLAEQKGDGDYAHLLREIMRFFQTGIPPVTEAQTLEIYAFMAAADESKRRGGAEVSLAEVMPARGAGHGTNAVNQHPLEGTTPPSAR